MKNETKISYLQVTQWRRAGDSFPHKVFVLIAVSCYNVTIFHLSSATKWRTLVTANKSVNILINNDETNSANCENRFSCLQKQDCPLRLLCLWTGPKNCSVHQKQLNACNFCRSFTCRIWISSLTQKKSYNNKVQNANQVWRFESHVRTITSLLEVIITVGLLCEMLELMHEK